MLLPFNFLQSSSSFRHLHFSHTALVNLRFNGPTPSPSSSRPTYCLISTGVDDTRFSKFRSATLSRSMAVCLSSCSISNLDT